ncbi:protein YIPF5-like [Planococcus citri]|uniref:protein YIPF5-like n=1 Tax=Planococcus citri TaxID=170843 RepID=UPI0031F99EBA
MAFYETDYQQNANNPSHFIPAEDYENNPNNQYLNPSYYGHQTNQPLYPATPEYAFMDDNNVYKKADFNDEEFEPPLLEELEIDLFVIRKRLIAILDPFHSGVVMGSYDLAGPCFICVLFAFCSFISGANINFNHVYSLSAFSCLFMYLLLTLMISSEEIKLSSVTSILGYSLLPLVLLSSVGLFINLYSLVGIILSTVAVLWCAFAATKMFTSMGNTVDKKMLIAYPCVLCYGVFTLCLIFK